MIGADVEVPCVDGRARRYVNLDYAASTPAMAGVWDVVGDFLPWHSSVHRGSGYKSQLATAAYRAGATSTTARTASTGRHPRCARCRGRGVTSRRPRARRRGR